MTGALTAGVLGIVPILLAALGGLLSERAGVMAIGLEGYIIAGAFAGLWGGNAAGTWAGVAMAVAAGLLIGMLVAFLCVTLSANQAVVGLTAILLATGITDYLNSTLFEGAYTSLSGLPSLPVPGLSKIPVIGPALFDQPFFVYFAIAMTVVLALMFKYSMPGLALHAVGENPPAAQVRGISVLRVRYAAVLASGVLAALGGATFTVVQGLTFSPTMGAGRGFIALAAIYLGGWRVLPVVAACVVFGLTNVAQVWANVLGLHVPPSILSTLPYLVTLVALVLFARRAVMPGGLGVPFAREQRVADE